MFMILKKSTLISYHNTSQTSSEVHIHFEVDINIRFKYDVHTFRSKDILYLEEQNDNEKMALRSELVEKQK